MTPNCNFIGIEKIVGPYKDMLNVWQDFTTTGSKVSSLTIVVCTAIKLRCRGCGCSYHENVEVIMLRIVGL